MRVVEPREMAEIDRVAIEEQNIPGLVLMENAGARVADVVVDMLSGIAGKRAAIWSGKGNNGGDGFVIARLLAESGLAADVFLLCEPEEVRGDAAANLERLAGLPVTVVTVTDEDKLAEFTGTSPPYDVVVDAIFGTGFSGEPLDLFAAAIDAINAYGRPVLSVDIPSGVSGDTGAVTGNAVRATRTVTFALPKIGLVQFPGAGFVGTLDVVDIGIPPGLLDRVPSSDIYLTSAEEAESLLPPRPPDVHKRQCGNVLVVGGSPGMTGAAAMCARACLRAGAGLVTVGVPEGLHQIMEVKLTEAMTVPLPQDDDGALSRNAVAVIESLIDDFDVIALGPGLSTGKEPSELVRELVSGTDKPIVLDADGLNAMVGHTELLGGRDGPLVLTPHPGEMSRLSGMQAREVQADRVSMAVRWSENFDSVLVLKGANTVVAEPGGRVRINTTGNPGMATAGMGDVLTGCIASLIAQGQVAFESAVAGVYFHGYAADLAAQMDAMVGMVAGDVIRHLPLAMRRP